MRRTKGSRRSLRAFDPVSATGRPRRRIVQREVIKALLHVVRNNVKAAYRRTDLFERQHRLMDWTTVEADTEPDATRIPAI